jgi:hypothetical protein
MCNYTTIFEKLLDIINWNTLKKSAYKLDIDYSTALIQLTVSKKINKFGSVKLMDS